MRSYLMTVHQFFSGDTEFVIEAENKEDAVARGTLYVKQSGKFLVGNCDYNSVKCIKKLQKKKRR